jgi:hypothetical protein
MIAVGFPLPYPSPGGAATAVGDHGDVAAYIVVAVFWTVMLFLVWLGSRANPSTPPDDGGWDGPDDFPPDIPPDPREKDLFVPPEWTRDYDLAGVR